jgi:hypothetical protein
MARPIWNSQGLSPNETAIDAYGNPILSEEERMKQRLIQAEIKRRQQLQKARSGPLLRQQGAYEGTPKVTSSWDNLFVPNVAGGVNLNSPFNIGAGKPTININERNIRPGYSPQRGKGGIPSQMYGVPQRVRGAGTGKTAYMDGKLISSGESYKPAGPTGRQLTGPMAPNPLMPARQTAMPEEEDEFMSWDDRMFLLSLMEGMQGGKPPTPYGTAVGGGNKAWAPLPFPRMA